MGDKVDEAIKIIGRKIGKAWKSLARALDFEETDIDAITYANPHDLKECIHSFFKQWKEKQGSNASVPRLVNGLLKAELNAIADEVSKDCIGRPISSRLLHKDASSVASNSSVPLPTEVERDKTAVTVSNTSTASDIVTSITSPTTPTTTTASSTSNPRSPQQTFEVGDMIRIKGAEDKGGGVVKWVGILKNGSQAAGIEMDNKLEGGHDGLWEGESHFKCPKGHGIYMPFFRIMKDPLFLPDNDIDLNDLTSGTGTSPGLYRSVSDSATNPTLTKRKSSETDKPLPEKIFDKFLELAATDPGDSTDGDGVLKVTFPGDRVGLIIGTEGATIHEIEDTTHTTIKISHNRYLPTSNATALITGSKENCEKALMLMCKKLNEKICRLQAIEETITVPDSSVGRIIGTDGSTKKAIEKLSGAKVKIEQEKRELMVFRLLGSDAKIIIKGSEEQISRAKQLIKMAQDGENIVLLQDVLTEVFQVMKAMGFELS